MRASQDCAQPQINTSERVLFYLEVIGEPGNVLVALSWVMLLNSDSTSWTINGQADCFDLERSGDMSSLFPGVFHTTIASDGGTFSALLARVYTGQHRASLFAMISRRHNTYGRTACINRAERKAGATKCFWQPE
jgi:hypothetical protein